MKISRILLAITLFGATYAFADLYEWKDKEGIVHMTDDIGRVPEEYQDKVKVYKTKAAPAPSPAEKREAPPPAPAEEKATELYGDQPLEWWQQTIKKKKEEVQAIEAAVASKRQYIEVYEGGRRFGQVYGMSDIDTYSRYKQELADDEARLQTLKDELDELRRKATIAGVPTDIRE